MPPDKQLLEDSAIELGVDPEQPWNTAHPPTE